VPPDTFIPIAEETGLMIAIGRFVLTRACEQAAQWERDGVGVQVAVNVSGRQFEDPDFAAQVELILDGAGLPHASLCLEVTETLLMSDTVRSTQLMRDIHALGVQLSIDDFGTGYSSLAYLHRFAFDELKIDRAFIDGMMELAGQRTLVEATVAMGKALGLAIVAEGVETEEQAALLRSLGCDVAQGYLFARPQPPDAIQLPARTAAELR
jgi:EAL domain-containing protein (putative c-di-GMP-specific phosphodiesterase class I)